MVNSSRFEKWLQSEALSFDHNESSTVSQVVDAVVAASGDGVEILALGEAMHGGEEFLRLRNAMFRSLVERHGFTAIAVESSFPRGAIVDRYVAGLEATSYDAIQNVGFSHNFGVLEANRELVEWMKDYNASQSNDRKVRFYGFDSPTEMMYSDSPRQLINVALNYFASMTPSQGQQIQERISALLGDDAKWENLDAMMDYTKSIGASAEAKELRLELEIFIADLRYRRPEFVAATGEAAYEEAVHHAQAARQMCNYHALVASDSPNRCVDLLGLRDLMMADNLLYIAAQERRRAGEESTKTNRGRVFAFAHNSHMKRGQAEWQWGPQLMQWWPAGAQLASTLRDRYIVIGTGVGTSPENGIGEPEVGTIETRMLNVSGPDRIVPTHRGNGHSAELSAFPPRSGSTKNFSYFPFNSQSFVDFDWLCMLDKTGYSRGGPPLG